MRKLFSALLAVLAVISIIGGISISAEEVTTVAPGASWCLNAEKNSASIIVDVDRDRHAYIRLDSELQESIQKDTYVYSVVTNGVHTVHLYDKNNIEVEKYDFDITGVQIPDSTITQDPSSSSVTYSKPVASFTVSADVERYALADIQDTSIVDPALSLKEEVWQIRDASGAVVYTSSNKPVQLNYAADDYTIVLKVKDSADQWSDEYAKVVGVTEKSTIGEQSLSDFTENKLETEWTNQDLQFKLEYSDLGGSQLEFGKFCVTNYLEHSDDIELCDMVIPDTYKTDGLEPVYISFKDNNIYYRVGDTGTEQLVEGATAGGNHYIHAQAKDNAGNVYQTHTGNIKYDKIKPTFDPITLNTEMTNRDVVLDVKIRDENSKIGLVEFRRVVDSMMPNVPWTIAGDYRATGGGNVVSERLIFEYSGVYEVRATDLAGNVATTTIEIKNIDKESPTLSEVNVYDSRGLLNRIKSSLPIFSNKDITIDLVGAEDCVFEFGDRNASGMIKSSDTKHDGIKMPSGFAPDDITTREYGYYASSGVDKLQYQFVDCDVLYKWESPRMYISASNWQDATLVGDKATITMNKECTGWLFTRVIDKAGNVSTDKDSKALERGIVVDKTPPVIHEVNLVVLDSTFKLLNDKTKIGMGKGYWTKDWIGVELSATDTGAGVQYLVYNGKIDDKSEITNALDTVRSKRLVIPWENSSIRVGTTRNPVTSICENKYKMNGDSFDPYFGHLFTVWDRTAMLDSSHPDGDIPYNKGNVATICVPIKWIDTKKPSVTNLTIQEPGVFTKDSKVLLLQAEDLIATEQSNMSGIDYVELEENGVKTLYYVTAEKHSGVTNMDCSNNLSTVESPSIDAGVQSLDAWIRVFTNGEKIVRVVDKAGNVALEKTIEVTQIDVTPPQLVEFVQDIKSPTNENIELTVKVSDNAKKDPVLATTGIHKLYMPKFLGGASRGTYAEYTKWSMPVIKQDATGKQYVEGSLSKDGYEEITYAELSEDPGKYEVDIENGIVFATVGNFTFVAEDGAGNLASFTSPKYTNYEVALPVAPNLVTYTVETKRGSDGSVIGQPSEVILSDGWTSECPTLKAFGSSAQSGISEYQLKVTKLSDTADFKSNVGNYTGALIDSDGVTENGVKASGDLPKNAHNGRLGAWGKKLSDSREFTVKKLLKSGDTYVGESDGWVNTKDLSPEKLELSFPNEGVYEVLARTVSNAGNISNVSVYTVMCDFISPRIDDFDVTDSPSGGKRVKLKVIDNLSGIKDIRGSGTYLSDWVYDVQNVSVASFTVLDKANNSRTYRVSLVKDAVTPPPVVKPSDYKSSAGGRTELGNNFEDWNSIIVSKNLNREGLRDYVDERVYPQLINEPEETNRNDMQVVSEDGDYEYNLATPKGFVWQKVESKPIDMRTWVEKFLDWLQGHLGVLAVGMLVIGFIVWLFWFLLVKVRKKKESIEEAELNADIDRAGVIKSARELLDEFDAKH